MRFNEIKTVESENMLTEGYTIGDIAETLWGAAVTAAFENYPSPATASDVNRIMGGLKNLSYSSTRKDGLKSTLADQIVFVNQIAMAAHAKDVKTWPKSSFPANRISVVTTNVLKDANMQVKTAGLDLKEIFANGKADKIVIGAQGGADQKGTKVDVAITHSVQGQSETIHLGYSLKTNDKDAELMPVGQNPAVNSPKGQGKSVVDFFTELGIKNIDEPLYSAYVNLNNKIKNSFATGDKAAGAILRKQGEVNKIINANMATAVKQINTRVKSDSEEQRFFQDLINFLKIHINKGEDNLKLLTIGKTDVYTSTIEQFAKAAPNLKLSAEHFPSSQKFFIYAYDEQTKQKLTIIEIRLKSTGGKPSSTNANVYRSLRYTLTVSTGSGYNKFAKIIDQTADTVDDTVDDIRFSG